MNEVRKVILSLAVIGLVLSMGCSGTERKDMIVAEIDTRTITIGEFETTAETLENKYLPETDDLEGKKELLKHMVNREVMVLKAQALGYQKEEAFVKFLNQFKGPFLITALWNEEITKKVVVTEEEIDYYWEQMQYEYTLSQLIVANESEAFEYRERIVEGGEDFAEMARKYSFGPAAADGGHIGSSPVGKIHWWIEEILFQMKEGEVSPPVRTDTGWALLLVHKKRKIMPELDRDYASRRVRGIKEFKGRDELKKQIESNINLQFFSDAIDIAFDHLPEDIPFEDIVNYKVTKSNAPVIDLPEQYKDMIICQYDDGDYTLGDFVEYHSMSSLVERPRRQYGKESIVRLFKKLIYDKVLPVYAENVAKVLDNPDVRDNYEKRREQFLVYRLYQDQIEDEVMVNTGEIREYYNSNKEFLMTQERRDYQIIVLDDIDTAKLVSGKAKAGEDFNRLVARYSKDPTVKENIGKTGLQYSGNYLEYDGVAFALEGVGAVSDAFKISRGWVVLKILEIEPSRIPTLGEATNTIKKQLVEEKSSKLMEKKMTEWRKAYIITINERNLKNANMSRTRL